MNDRVPLLTSKNVVKRYQMADTAIDVLKGVDLELMAGERVAIVGRSGSGRAVCCTCWRGWMRLMPEKFSWQESQ